MAEPFVPKKVLRGHVAPMPKKLVIEEPKVDFQSGGAGADVMFQASGLESLAKTLLNMGKQMRDAAGYEMSEILHDIIEDSGANYVPKDTMALYDSRNADEYDPKSEAEIIELACWYGSPIEDKQRFSFEQVTDQTGTITVSKSKSGFRVKEPEKYALEQHENMDYKHPHGGGPKYLALPWNKMVPSMEKRIAGACGIVLGESNYLNEVAKKLDTFTSSYPGYGTPRRPRASRKPSTKRKAKKS